MFLFVFFVTFLLIPAAAQDVFIVGVESNPAGQDRGNEWVLLFNAGAQPVDLSGWSLVTEDGDIHTLHQTIPACESLQVKFAAQFIDNKDAVLALLDSSGIRIDTTPSISDSKNDDDVWSIPTPKCDGSEPLPDTSPPVLPPPPLVPGDVLTVTFVDLGHAGESILLVAPGGTAMLIDGGLARSYDRLEHVMNGNDIDSIDVMVATHADQDHIEGLTSVIHDPDIDVERVLLSHVDATTKTYANFVDSIRSSQIPSQFVYAGHAINLADSLTARVLSPPPQGISDSSSLRNTNSLVIHLEYGAVSFLFTGDATTKTERWIVSNMPGLDIDIMNGPHHGSRHSSTASFIDHVTPQLVVFSADADNRYGHPHPDAISRYDARGIVNYQTGVDGSVEIRTDGVGCSVILAGASPVPCYDGIDIVGSASQPPHEDIKVSSNPKTEPASKARAVPEWVKSTTKWWHEGLVTDQEFIGGIQYLIEYGIIVIQDTQESASAAPDGIPAWIKTNAEWWTSGYISDGEFLRGIEYLIQVGVIQVAPT